MFQICETTDINTFHVGTKGIQVQFSGTRNAIQSQRFHSRHISQIKITQRKKQTTYIDKLQLFCPKSSLRMIPYFHIYIPLRQSLKKGLLFSVYDRFPNLSPFVPHLPQCLQAARVMNKIITHILRTNYTLSFHVIFKLATYKSKKRNRCHTQ